MTARHFSFRILDCSTAAGACVLPIETNSCPFCSPDPSKVSIANEHALVLRDGFPVSPGHCLVVPKQHAASFFDLSLEVQTSIWKLVSDVRAKLAQEFHPDGFNVGLNDGQAAGQTVMHAHVHIIPRFITDVPDPRGGIRCVIPQHADYWKENR